MRRWINILAVFAVLLHAGALVRHHAVMLNADTQHQALLADLATICHGGGGTQRLAATDLPAIPQPSDAQNGCPLCAGVTTAFVIAHQAQAPAAPIVYARAHTFGHVQFVVSDLTETRHPPSRGPPAVV
ncbi:MAG: DUF2946 family protein [Hyphomicrobiaceae bacterium]